MATMLARFLRHSLRVNSSRCINFHKFTSRSLLRTDLRSVHSSYYLCNGSVNMTLIMPSGAKHRIKGTPGETLLDCIKNSSVEVEGFGLCDGGAACSTCHVIFKEEDYAKLPFMEDIEADVLELTYRCASTSRLGCQVMVIPELEGMEISVPSFRVDIRETGACSSSQTDS